MDAISVVWVGASALIGGIIAAVLGWLDSKETFDARKFSASAVRALVAAIVFAVGYNFAEDVSLMDIGIAFLGGAGVDSLGNRILGAIRTR